MTNRGSRAGFVTTLLVVAALSGGVVTPAFAQKQAPAATRDADRDGVMDNRDRCRNTPSGTRVDAAGCPVPAGQAQSGPAAGPPATAPAAAAPTAGQQPGATAVQPQAQAGGPLAQPPPGQPAAPPGRPAATGQTAAPAAGQPASPAAGQPAVPTAGQPAAAPAAGGQTAQAGTARQQAAAPPSGGATGAAPAVTAPVTQAARPTPTAAAPPGPPAAAQPMPPVSVPVPPVTSPTLTAGFWMPAYTGRSRAEVLEYARTLAIRLDTAVVALVEIFRNTSGAPMVGATGPSVLSTREKARWERCRLIHYDLLTFADAATFLKDSLTSSPALGRATAALDEALQDLQATAECDNVVSMVEAPDRWAPWEQNYANSARSFYRDWYTQLRAVHEADREFARALNPALAAARQFPVPVGLPPNAPTIGAVR